MACMILLGVGTAVPDEDRGYTHMVWNGPGGPMLIDVGGSTYQRLLKAGVDPLTLQSILLTHSHADHINGLPALLFSLYLGGRREAVTIYGLEPTLALAQRVLEAFDLEKYVVPVVWNPLDGGDEVMLHGEWILRTALGDHPRPCLALCFEDRVSGKRLAYSGDTQPCQSVIDLARGAHILIHEATVAEPLIGHTTPHQAGQVAVQASVQRMVLVHFSPRLTMPESQALAEVQRGGFAGPSEVGCEYQVLEL